MMFPMRRLHLAAGLAAMVAAGLVLSAGPGRAQAPEGYRIAAGDRLSIQVEELAESNGEIEVSSDGTLLVPRVGIVVVRDLTLEEARLRIRDRLTGLGVRDPTVRLRLVAFGSRPVSVLGAVQTPGSLPIRTSERLFDVLLRSGGLATDHGAEIIISRQAENGLRDQVAIEIAALIDRGDPVANIPIVPGDRINVPAARQITYFINGEVSTGGAVTVSLGQRETLLTAIARAGGLTENASKKIIITRRGSDGSLVTIEAHYGRIQSGREPDLPIQDRDIIEVRESFF